MPIGVFLMFHLFTNMQMAFSTFQHEVDWIHSMPALLFLEIFGLWLPIAFHAALGLVYTFSGKVNTRHYRYEGNWRYTLQRVTGILALIFIVVHVATLRWRWTILGEHTPFFSYGWDVPGVEGSTGALVPLATATTAIAIQTSWLVILLYLVGVYSSVYHFANGLWTAAITWGLTITKQAQMRWGVICIALFLGLSVFAAVAMRAAVTYEPTELERASLAKTLEVYRATGKYPHLGDPPLPPARAATVTPPAQPETE